MSAVGRDYVSHRVLELLFMAVRWALHRNLDSLRWDSHCGGELLNGRFVENRY